MKEWESGILLWSQYVFRPLTPSPPPHTPTEQYGTSHNKYIYNFPQSLHFYTLSSVISNCATESEVPREASILKKRVWISYLNYNTREKVLKYPLCWKDDLNYLKYWSSYIGEKVLKYPHCWKKVWSTYSIEAPLLERRYWSTYAMLER